MTAVTTVYINNTGLTQVQFAGRLHSDRSGVQFWGPLLGQLCPGTNRVNRLGSKAAKLTTGVNRLGSTAAKLTTGVHRLGSTAAKLTTGVNRLGSTAAKLTTGLTKLTTGLTKLTTGVNRLGSTAAKLTTGVYRLPPQQPTTCTCRVATVVHITCSSMHSAFLSPASQQYDRVSLGQSACCEK